MTVARWVAASRAGFGLPHSPEDASASNGASSPVDRVRLGRHVDRDPGAGDDPERRGTATGDHPVVDG
ncbi:MAG: hypothetical protein ACRDT2_07530, partial [Natronosporangium sp.]